MANIRLHYIPTDCIYISLYTSGPKPLSEMGWDKDKLIGDENVFCTALQHTNEIPGLILEFYRSQA